MEDAMAAWAKYAEPGEEHAYLQRMEGSWNARVKFWMQPGADPQESEGKMSNQLILGGRFLQSNYEGDTPMGPFQGFSLDGYDKLEEKYVGVWADTMGTMMMVFRGHVEDDVRTMIAEYKDPMSGNPTKMKGVTTIVGENEHKYQGYGLMPNGEWFQQMEIVYTR